jgi:DNA-binding GntR family transcriptional regulator
MVRASVRTRSQHPETRRQHHAILRALRRRDAAAAEAAVRAHVFRFRDLVAGRLPGDA